MKLSALILFTILFFNYTYAQQNLVPNGSFEDTVGCPNSLDQIYKARGWYKPTTATPDYFNLCSNPLFQVSVPINGIGFQYPKTGSAYAGFGCVFDSSFYNYREYIQIKLKQKLKIGREYKIKFYVSRADSVSYALANIGALISATSYTCNCDTSISMVPQAFSNKFIIDSQDWQMIEGRFISKGNEEYLTIGYFKNNNKPDTLRINNKALFSYYYVDDVELVEDKQELEIAINGVITPNGDNHNDFLTIDASQFNSENFKVEIINRWGNIVFSSTNNEFKWDGTYKNSQLPSGSYFILLEGFLNDGSKFVYKNFIQLIY